MTRSSNPTAPKRPAFFTVAILVHLLEAGLAISMSLLGLIGIAIGIVAVSAEARGDDRVVAVIALLVGALFLLLLFLLALMRLFFAYKAWSLKSRWVWALLIFSILSMVLEPWGIAAALLTMVGSIPLLDNRDRPQATRARRPMDVPPEEGSRPFS